MFVLSYITPFEITYAAAKPHLDGLEQNFLMRGSFQFPPVFWDYQLSLLVGMEPVNVTEYIHSYQRGVGRYTRRLIQS